MNAFEKSLAKYIGEDKLKKIQQIKIGIAGAGGLGSNCAFNLVRSGFKRFKIVDFDTVQVSNINRQFYFLDQISMPKVDALKLNLLRINPDIEIEILNEKLEEKNIKVIFDCCDVVVEAFDLAKYKALFAENYISSDKLVVSASGLAGWGRIDDIVVKKVKPKFFLIGDLITGVSEENPPISPRVNVAAAKQADVILEYVLNRM